MLNAALTLPVKKWGEEHISCRGQNPSDISCVAATTSTLSSAGNREGTGVVNGSHAACSSGYVSEAGDSAPAEALAEENNAGSQSEVPDLGDATRDVTRSKDDRGMGTLIRPCNTSSPEHRAGVGCPERNLLYVEAGPSRAAEDDAVSSMVERSTRGSRDADPGAEKILPGLYGER